MLFAATVFIMASLGDVVAVHGHIDTHEFATIEACNKALPGMKKELLDELRSQKYKILKTESSCQKASVNTI
jgi:hypothetical protein